MTVIAPALSRLAVTLAALGLVFAPGTADVSPCELVSHSNAYLGRPVALTGEVRADIHQATITDVRCPRVALSFGRAREQVAGETQFYHAVHDAVGQPQRLVRFTALGMLRNGAAQNSPSMEFAVIEFRKVDVIEGGRVTTYLTRER